MNITGNAALDVLIGLFFLYFLLSIVCSAINEAFASVLNLRAKTLEKGIRSLLASKEKTNDFYEHWRVKTLFKPAGWIRRGKRRPSYLPPRVFALTVLDTFAPPGGGVDSNDLVRRARRVVNNLDNQTVKGLLQDALDEAGADINKFRVALEKSFNDVMDRASGWYKRRVQLILFIVALGVVGLVNADSYALGQRLWKDDALRASVVAQANAVVKQGENASCAQVTSDTTSADRAAKCIDQVKQLSLPLGWSNATSPHSLHDGFGKVLGLLVTAFALTLGAPFWFGLLGKVAQLRGTGPSPGEKKSASQ